MFRHAYEKLLSWKQSTHRRPLVIRGVRQCGKTYLMKAFGSENYENVAYFNFETSRDLNALFDGPLDTSRLISQLSLWIRTPIREGSTLIIMDEIQECRRALTSLKYFAEDAPGFHVICAGSLLGLHIKERSGTDSVSDSFPVGKVEILDMFPMDYEEFLIACGETDMLDYLRGLDPTERIPEFMVTRLEDRLEEYYAVGGMPDAVSTWIDSHDISRVREVQSHILETYSLDLNKHPVDTKGTLEAVWENIPSQQMKDNSRFVFGHSVAGARGADLEAAVVWLEKAGMVYRVRRIEKPSRPLSMYETSLYKLYMADIGLFECRSEGPSGFDGMNPEDYKDYKGALAESFVLQQLVVRFGRRQHYWRSDATAEVDFVASMFHEPVPIEVKSGHAKSSKSLKVYRERYHPRIAVKVSMDPDLGGTAVVHIPLYMMWDLERRVRAALEALGWKDPDEGFGSSTLGGPLRIPRPDDEDGGQRHP